MSDHCDKSGVCNLYVRSHRDVLRVNNSLYLRKKTKRQMN